MQNLITNRSQFITTITLLLSALFFTSCDTCIPEKESKFNSIEISSISQEDIRNCAIQCYNEIFNYNSANCDTARITVKSIQKDNALYSRSSTENSNLYIVNFDEEKGFALIAQKDQRYYLIGITDQGNYYPETGTDNYQFQNWYNTIIQVIGSGPIENLTNNEIFIPNRPDEPKDSLDLKLQHKEWNDTISKYFLNPQCRHAWGQGDYNTSNLNLERCEGYYFINGLCGCGPIALAQLCMTYRYPKSLHMDQPGIGEVVNFNWTQMSQHLNVGFPDSEYGIHCQFAPSSTHEKIARLCKIIGNYGHVHGDETGTSISSDYLYMTACMLFGHNNVSADWKDLNDNVGLPRNYNFIVIGRSQFEGKAGHAWICDGEKNVRYYHCYATRYNSYDPWQLQEKTEVKVHLFHYNWGWYGSCNGWFTPLPQILNYNTQMGYKDLRYISIKNPSK